MEGVEDASMAEGSCSPAVEEHMAMRVQFTPMLLASKLSGLESELARTSSLSESGAGCSGAASPSTPGCGSPCGSSHSPPGVNLRERSHHAIANRPSLIISPDADRRAVRRDAFSRELGAALSVEAEASERGGGSEGSFAQRCGGGA